MKVNLEYIDGVLVISVSALQLCRCVSLKSCISSQIRSRSLRYKNKYVKDGCTTYKNEFYDRILDNVESMCKYICNLIMINLQQHFLNAVQIFCVFWFSFLFLYTFLVKDTFKSKTQGTKYSCWIGMIN